MSGMRRQGAWMMAAGWGLAIVIAYYFFSGALQRRANPNTFSALEGQRGELVLRRNAARQYLGEGEVEGRRAVFLVDTGASQTAISGQLADELRLPILSEQMVSTANGAALAGETVIEEMRLGPLLFRQVRALVLPDMGGLDLLVGMNTLGAMDMEQSDGVLVIRAPGGGG